MVLKEKPKREKPLTEKQQAAIARMREKLAEYRKVQREAKEYELKEAQKKREEVLKKAVEETKKNEPKAELQIRKQKGAPRGKLHKKPVRRLPPPEETSATSDISESDSDSSSEDSETRKYVRKSERRMRAVKMIDERLRHVNPYFKNNMSIF